MHDEEETNSAPSLPPPIPCPVFEANICSWWW